MANTDVALDELRTFVYTDSFYQISDDGGTNTNTLKFIQDWEFTLSMADFDIDHIDTGKPIFTRKSDIVGTFRFVQKNTIDVYDETNPPTNNLTASRWMIQIANGKPVSITFITILTASDDGNATHGTLTIQFTGRIMETPLVQVRDTGVQELEVIGEITAVVKVDVTPGS